MSERLTYEELLAVREEMTREQVAAIAERVQAVNKAVEALARQLEGSPLQAAGRWHGRSLYARLLEGTFGIQGLVEQAEEALR